jgi:two-component system, OmpR family, sensor histidine kinase ResE
MFRKHRLYRLRTQLILTFLLSSLGIVFAISLPILVLINRQTASQAQLLLDQATLTTQAFLASERSDLQNLALLISQRPTLTRLLEEQDFATLESYLETLRDSVELDLIVVCAGGKEIKGIGENISMTELCQTNPQSEYAIFSSNADLYLHTAVNLESPAQPAYHVVIGKRGSLILEELQKETGLLYFLIWNERVIDSSDPAIEVISIQAQELQNIADQTSDSTLEQRAFNINAHQYILASFVIDSPSDIQLISALNVDEQIATQQNLLRTLTFTFFMIVLIAFGLGVWQAQWISRPIVDLADAAAKFRQGNLDAPVSIASSVSEISQLTNTLEDARIALQHSMEQLQAEKAWIEQLLNSIVEGTLTLDAQHRITFASAGVGKILGRETDQLIGRKVDDIFLSTEGETSFSNQLPDTGQQRRISIKLKSGEERLLSISKADFLPTAASDANQALVIRDVSNEEYIHRILGDFMANITHEFRTPLAALEASSELLLDNLRSLSKKEIAELVVSLNLGIINLQTLIDNLIEAASMEAGRFKVAIQSVPFDIIMKEAQEVMQPLAEKYTLKLVAIPVEKNILVMADQRRTVQVLVNLLSNAIKHSPDHGTIRINHSVMDEKLRIEVIDEGGGVPELQRNNLFQRFSNLDVPNKRAKQGAGLGLSVVKTIVEAQHGEVGISDHPEGGNSFWFTLPLASKAQQ